MATFRAIEKGYYGDVIHSPDHHPSFEAPDDFQCTWAEPADGAKVEAPAKVSAETETAESVLETEADAGIPDDVPAVTEDANEAAGVEVL